MSTNVNKSGEAPVSSCSTDTSRISCNASEHEGCAPVKSEAGVGIQKNTDFVTLRCSGVWVNTSLHNVIPVLEKAMSRFCDNAMVWDVSGITLIDSAGMMVVMHYSDAFREHGCTVEIRGAGAEFKNMQALVQKYVITEKGGRASLSSRLLEPLQGLGLLASAAALDALEFLSFLGESFMTLLYSLIHPFSVRYKAVFKNIQDAGVRALPIISLTSFLIGVVIAYQGAVQLAKFGGNIFIVDMIGISVTRELAPLITAIVVAGRTGSSYTAQIGVMKITEEIDAMRVMGFTPHRFLVQPRIIALMIALPLMIFFADIVGIFGGMVIAHVHLDISYLAFLHRLQNVLEVKHVWIGICKGPFFAWLIAVVGCFRGFQVSINTESIGRYTTISVVNSIFLVIACDALFSVLLTQLGI